MSDRKTLPDDLAHIQRSFVVRHSFVVRIWQEEGRPGWKGWVQHARTGESLFVRELDELLAFIEDRTGKLTDLTRKGLK